MRRRKSPGAAVTRCPAGVVRWTARYSGSLPSSRSEAGWAAWAATGSSATAASATISTLRTRRTEGPNGDGMKASG